MASTTLILKDPNAINKTRVICLLTDGREVRLKLYSDFSVKPKHWSKVNKNVLSADKNAVEINKSLLLFKNKVLNIYDDAKQNGFVATTEYIKEKLKPTEIAVTKNVRFWSVWEYYLSAKKNNYKPRSFEKFKYLKNHLIEFEKFDKIPLELETASKKTMDRLQDYFFNKAGLNTQTTSKYLDLFKVFLNWAFNEQYTKNNSYNTFQSIKQPDALKVILTNEDIEKIRKAKLPQGYLSNVRELLILSTLTGLRHSDFSRISKEHVKGCVGEKYLQIRMTKTSTFVDVPLTIESEKIITKIIEKELHAISNQKMNKYVKELCELAKVNESFEVHKYKGKMAVITHVPKHKLITTHTGRRTFATNLMLKGVPPMVVMKYTGHRDLKSFTKYVNIPKTVEFDLVRSALA
jgi:site-specific recombinase XerD